MDWDMSSFTEVDTPCRKIKELKLGSQFLSGRLRYQLT